MDARHFKGIPLNEHDNQPICDLLEIEVVALIDKKSMKFKLPKPVAFPKEGFYIVLKRIVPIEVFRNRNKTYAVNPYIRAKYVKEEANKVMSFEQLSLRKNELKDFSKIGDTFATGIQ